MSAAYKALMRLEEQYLLDAGWEKKADDQWVLEGERDTPVKFGHAINIEKAEGVDAGLVAAEETYLIASGWKKEAAEQWFKPTELQKRHHDREFSEPRTKAVNIQKAYDRNRNKTGLGK